MIKLFVSALIFLWASPAFGHAPVGHVFVAEKVIENNVSGESVLARLLSARFPDFNKDEIPSLTSYYLAGSLGPDLVGFFPEGEETASMLSHYLLTGDLTEALIELAITPEEFAFAIGWVTHVVSDVVAHVDSINVTVAEVLGIEDQYPQGVTYDYDPLAFCRVAAGADLRLLKQRGYERGEFKNKFRVPLSPSYPNSNTFIEEAYLRVYGIKLNREFLYKVSGNINNDMDLIAEAFVSMGYLNIKDPDPIDRAMALVNLVNHVTIRPVLMASLKFMDNSSGSQAILDPYQLTPNQINRYDAAFEKSVRVVLEVLEQTNIKIPNKNLDTGKPTFEAVDDPAWALLEELKRHKPSQIEVWQANYPSDVANELIMKWDNSVRKHTTE